MNVWNEMTWTPTDQELEAERQYWALEDMRLEVAEWEAQKAEMELDFESWPVADLVEELDTVLTLTPDQVDIIEALREAIARHRDQAA